MDAASIEQMNKVRASLGLAPLPVPGNDGPQFKSKDESGSDSEEDLSTLEKRQAAAGGNWEKLEVERREKLERQRRKDAAKKARDAAQRFSKLSGKGLGEASDGEAEMDTRAWLLQQKKRQKKIERARKMEEELAAREKEMQAEYTSKDLAGIKVGHEAGNFDEMTGEQILTLKDAEIGDESEDDELENAELRANERLKEKLELKKKRPDYDPTEQGEEKTILSKYDEEIDGKKQKRFTLDGLGGTVEAAHNTLDADGEVKRKGVKISLDVLKADEIASDYVEAGPIKVRKPKKSKKEKQVRKKADDDDNIFPSAEATVESEPLDDKMEIDDSIVANGSSRKRAFEFDDDDDLQAKLAEQRRQALKKRKKTDAAEIARQMREEMAIDENDLPEEGGLTLDETTEFVANLKRPEAPEERLRHRGNAPRKDIAESDDEDRDGDGDTAMAERSYADIDRDDDPGRYARETSTPAPNLTATGLEEEAHMSGAGIGASLELLRRRGLVAEHDTATMSERDRQRSKFLREKQHLMDEFDAKARRERENERKAGRWDKMSTREREAYAKQQNEARERHLHQLLDREFKAKYRPDVTLRYTDEFGRELNQKEAFKHMSHMFHGKGSGKLKTEKRLKKIEDEKKEMAKGVLNVGDEGGMMNVQGREGRRQGKAGVRLQ